MIHATLSGLVRLLDTLSVTDTWTTQQQPFLAHIRKTCAHLAAQTADLPNEETQLYALVAVFDEAFFKQLSVVYGYAKLLLESPQAFGGAQVSPAQRALLQDVFGYSMALAKWLSELPNAAQTWRQQARAKPAAAHDLAVLLAEQLPLLRYVARGCQLRPTFEAGAWATCRPYHLEAFVLYVVRAMADALRETAHPTPDIFLACAPIAQGAHLTLECPTALDLATLFGRHGGAHYLRALFDDDGGYFPHVEADLTRLEVRLPKP